jgi:hypothetical protein
MTTPKVGPHSGRRVVIQPDERVRFWKRVRKTSGCWLWKGSCNAQTGYGNMHLRSVSGGPVPAHRIAYTISKGAIPEGLCVMHACDNPKCVKPDHLALGTHRDNMVDMYAKGRGPDKTGPHKTHCVRGHLRFGSHLKDGASQCQRCVAEKNAAAGLARKEQWRQRFAARLAPLLPENPDDLEDRMSFRHAAVLKSWYGLYGCEVMTLQEMADVLGVSRQRVEQLLTKAVALLGCEIPRADLEQSEPAADTVAA